MATDFGNLRSIFVLEPVGDHFVLSVGSGGAGAGAGAGAKAGAGKGKAKPQAQTQGGGGKKDKGKKKKKGGDEPAVLGPDGKPLTKKELRMLKRKQDKEAAADSKSKGDTFGVLPIIRSTTITDRVWTRIEACTAAKADQTLLVRARLMSVRSKGNMVFLVLRQGFYTLQCLLAKSKTCSKQMLNFAAGISVESYVDVTGKLVMSPVPLESVSQSNVELQVATVHVVSKAEPLPFSVEDASRYIPPAEEAAAVAAEEAAAAAVAAGIAAGAGAGSGAGAGAGESGEAAGAGGKQAIRVSQFTRLNYRWVDLRTPANNAIMRVSSQVCQLFREFLLEHEFVEMQTPKLVAGTSEGGADVFRLKYFGRDACLAQSPQLYKQMVSACADFERVFEIGPVFRAENSNTHRHLTEFHGLDMEMAFNEHYYEVLDMFSDLFIHIFDGLNERCKGELEAIRAQYPFEDFKYLKPALRITYAEGMKLLQDAGYKVEPMSDLDSNMERALGAIVKEKYDTDFFMMDKYPMSVRPFYTMPDASDPAISNSYDFFMRGEEILSGAQRIHEPELLAERAKAHDIPLDTIKSYIDAFRHGAYPHGGGGVGLERVVMLFLNLGNVRKCTMFTRDPKRIAP